MADIVYNPETGSNATGTGTWANPYQFPLTSHGNPGDTYWLKRGSVHMTNTANGWSPKMGNGVGSVMSYVRAYGAAQVPHAILDTPNTTGPTLNISGGTTVNSNLTVEDLDVRTSGHSGIPFQLHANAGNLFNITLRRCVARGKPGGTKSGLFYVQSDATETLFVQNVLVEDSEFYDGEGHGAFAVDVTGLVYRRCKFARNGKAEGAHGASSLRRRTGFTSGFTGGPSVYQRTMTEFAQSTTDVSYVNVDSGASAGTYPSLVRNTATPTNPAPGEYGYVPGAGTGVLYVNLNGVNPNGQTLQVCWGRKTTVRYEFCEAWDNNAFDIYPYHEGHGIALDDFTDDSAIIGCRTWGNAGAGISLNRGDRNVVTGNVMRDNLWPGLVASRARNNRILNNTIRGNNQALRDAGFVNSYTSSVQISSMSTGNEIRNNIIDSMLRDYGLLVDASSASGTTAVSNAILSRLARVSGLSETDAKVIDSFDRYLEGDDTLRVPFKVGDVSVTNPLAALGSYAYGLLLRNGKGVPGRVPLGAYAAGRY